MGKPYAQELDALARTYTWAVRTDVTALAHAVERMASCPLAVVGSGGSFTAAHLTSTLHQQHARALAKAVTPLEVVSVVRPLRDITIMLLTAGGANPDILGAFRRLVSAEPRHLMVLCARHNSRLADLANRYKYVDMFEFCSPAERDGFLATNSLLAFSVLLTRAYSRAFSVRDPLPRSLRALVHPKRTTLQHQHDLELRCKTLWTREHLIVLFGSNTHAAALDLESKFSEAALGAVQIADFRNFAHGRHNWLAKHGASSAVVALVGQEDQELADSTLALLPAQVAQVMISISQVGAAARLAAIVLAMQITGCAGRARGVDPGRPGVPRFGRRLYHLRGLTARSTTQTMSAPREVAAIQRKANCDIDILTQEGRATFWRKAYRRFMTGITRQVFHGIVLDYDGTLCDARRRHCGWDSDIAARVERLLKLGVLVGVATGRGKSANTDLRQKLSKRLWHRVQVGYYNGADIGSLSDDAYPGQARAAGVMRKLAQALKNNATIRQAATCEVRAQQITIIPRTAAGAPSIWEAVQGTIARTANDAVTVARSGHSVDVVAPGASKTNLLRRIEESASNPNSAVLVIGDQGAWPGNDFALLSHPFSLSVDEVSPDPCTCWNLAPAGYRGIQATAYYLDRLVPTRIPGCVRLRLPGKRGKR